MKAVGRRPHAIWLCTCVTLLLLIATHSFYGAVPEDLLFFGLDIEWCPPFSADHNPIATLQICINESYLIFKIIHAHYVPDSLKEFLSNRAYTCVGVGVKSDLDNLERDYQIGNTDKIAAAAVVDADRKYQKVGVVVCGGKRSSGLGKREE